MGVNPSLGVVTIPSDTKEPIFDPQTEFRKNISRSVRAVLKRVDNPHIQPPNEDQDRALHVLSYALKLPDIWNETSALMILMAAQMEQSLASHIWEAYLQRAIDLCQIVGDEETKATLSLRLGFLFQIRGDFITADHHFLTSAGLFKKIGNQRKYAIALNRRAFVAFRANRFDEITDFVEQVDQILPENDPERAVSYMVLGWLEVERRNWQQSVDCFSKALEITQKQTNQREIARRLRDLAVGLQMEEKYDESIHYYNHAIELFGQIQDSYEQAIAKMNLGTLYLTLDRSDQANTLFTQAEPILRAANAKPDLAILYHNQGIIFRNWRRFEESKLSFNHSIEICSDLHNLNLLIQSTYELGLTHLTDGTLKTAIEIFNKALELIKMIPDNLNRDHLYQEIAAHIPVV